MSRKTKDFITTFINRYDNGFIPKKFYLWAAISTVAAALERKVWLPWHNGNVYPNMYVFLVSGPGVGKSSAIEPGERLLRKMAEKHQKIIRFIPEDITEAKLFDCLSDHDFFQYRKKHYPHTSAYFIASEGSVSFKRNEEHGIVKAFTRLYDKKDFEKATVSRKDIVRIKNPCINMLVGTTFHDLNTFLTKNGILGGFASRVTFVSHSAVKKRKSVWFDEEENKTERKALDTDLITDLHSIHKMVGGFTATQEVKAAWNIWWEAFDDEFIRTENEIKKAFMARKQVALHKLVQILSASESSSMQITIDHWNKALKLVDHVEKDLPKMLRRGQSTNTNSNEGIRSTIINLLEDKPGRYNKSSLAAAVMCKGHNSFAAKNAVELLAKDMHLIKTGTDGTLTFIGNPDFHG